MTSPTTPPPGQPDPASLLALGLATHAADAGKPQATPPPTPDELAAEFPRLEIIELLGRGGMGAVYKARQRDLDRLVALKILRPGLDADPGFAERFTREARALAQLNHPGIVTLYEFGRSSAGRYFILMEFVDGVNLRQLLDAGRLAPREALAIVPPLCDALQYAHDRRLIHRDIKPENLLVDRLGRVKIADFGIARLASENGDEGRPTDPKQPPAFILTSAGETMGTPAYMAPEQQTRATPIDHRADLYALGVVFYQMLTGELPAAGQLRPPSTRVLIDVRLDEIVLRALEKDPARRYSAASEFKTEVETFANASTASSSPAATPVSSDNGFSYRSNRTLFGLPLLHVATGMDPATGKRRIARGIVAIGDYAQGVFAFGGVAIGAFSFGGISLGLFGYGGLVLGLLVHGGLGLGALASFAGLAVAPIAMGGAAIGWYAYGGGAWGRHVNSPTTHDPAAVDFFGTWAREFTQTGSAVTSLLFVAGFTLMIMAIAWARKRATHASPQVNAAKDPVAPSLPLLPATVLVGFLVCLCGSLQFAAKHFPERVAVHFNMAGHADGWADRGVALLVFLLIGVGMSFFIPCLFAPLRFLPEDFINIPHHRFWLAPARASATHARLLREGLWLAALNAAFFWGLQILTHWAHLSTPPRLPMVALWVLTGFFLTAVALRITRMYRTFSHPERATTPPARSWLSRALQPAAPWLLMFLIFTAIIVPVSTALDILAAHQATAGQAVPADDQSAPVHRVKRSREITLSRSHPVAYDFDRGRFVEYPPSQQSVRGIDASVRWHANHGTDVFTDPGSHLPGLLFIGTDLVEVSPSTWDDGVEETVRDAGKPADGLMTFIPAPREDQPPETRVYRTPQGTVILVQILRANDAGDVTLRYRTLRAAPTSPDTTADSVEISPEDQRPLQFDRAGETMQNIVHRLRHEHGLRLAFENLDFTISDAKTAAQIIAEADLNAPYSKLEEALLKRARESQDPNTLLDLGARYKGMIKGDSLPDFFTRLTADTPYLARKIGQTWLIEPRAGSRLAFPVTLKTTGMTVDEAVHAIVKQAPGDRPIAIGLVFAMPYAPGTDPTPWLSVQAPELEFERIPASEALCKLGETARPGSVWELAGYQESRMLSFTSSPADEVLPVINTAQAWLLRMDLGSYSTAWHEASPLLRSALEEKKFSAAMLGARAPLGQVKIRRLHSATPLTRPPGAPEGRYVLMQFKTAFDSAPAALETVTFVREADGRWRACGYFINPEFALPAAP